MKIEGKSEVSYRGFAVKGRYSAVCLYGLLCTKNFVSEGVAIELAFVFLLGESTD